jgi:hypothetical protein
MTAQEAFVHVVARQVLRGLRESLTIAGQIGQPVEDVNAAVVCTVGGLEMLATALVICSTLATRPHASEATSSVDCGPQSSVERVARPPLRGARWSC